MVARGAPLAATTDELCRRVEGLVPEVACSVLTVDPSGLLFPLSGPSLPEHYSSQLAGFAMGPCAGSCGTAAYLRKPVAVHDIENDPRWAEFAALVLPLGYRACWSTPILAGDGRPVGTFAFYYREKRGPTPLEEQIVATCVNLCAIALERNEWRLEHERLAYADLLTGLSNRASFNAVIGDLSCGAAGAWGLLIIDLDNLKVVNDTFGHRTGDHLIQVAAGRIAVSALPNRTFRLGGDEFAVLVQDAQALENLERLADRILAELAVPAASDGHMIVPRATIGGAILAPGDTTAETVRQNADFALYHAKEIARGGYMFYAPGLGTSMSQRLSAIRDVGDALRENRIDAFYQPIVRLDTGEIVGLESLFRLTTRSGKVLSAGDFFEATTDVHIASELTRQMLATIAADVRSWLDQGIPFQHVGINVSSADFHSGTLFRQLSSAFEAANVPLKHLILEVTETVYMGQRDDAIAREIQAMRAKGLRVALDDFGTGFASLTHLLTVPVDVIKIDKSFVQKLGPDNGSAAIIEGLLGIAKKLGIRVVAEGIERPDQVTQLRAFGCDLGQGYLFSRAVDRHATTTLLLQEAQKTPGAAPDLAELDVQALRAAAGEFLAVSRQRDPGGVPRPARTRRAG
ncbi:MAG: EAL domain-containing protein [Sphingomonas sp.]